MPEPVSRHGLTTRVVNKAAMVVGAVRAASGISLSLHWNTRNFSGRSDRPAIQRLAP
jgi:hypothetical protein